MFFHLCCYGFSQGRKSLYNTAVYVINNVSPVYNEKFFECQLQRRDETITRAVCFSPRKSKIFADYSGKKFKISSGRNLYYFHTRSTLKKRFTRLQRILSDSYRLFSVNYVEMSDVP